MIKVNLLPYREERRKAQMLRQAVFLSLAVGIFLVVIVSIHAFMLLSTGDMEKKVAAANAELKHLQSITGDLEKFKKDKALVEKKLDIITNLEKNRHFPVELMNLLAARMPVGKMWLTALDEKDNVLRIDGVALDNETVALYMTDIEKAPHIASVDLISSQQSTISGMKLKIFKISCVLARG